MKNIVFKKENLKEYFLYSLFLLPLIGTSNPAYIIIFFYLLLNIKYLKLKINDILIFILIILFLLLKIEQSAANASILLVRYYFGFYLFYLFFNYNKTTFKLESLLWLFCFIVIVEAFLINTVVSIQWLPNYPKTEVGDFLGQTKILGFYQRPYSIGTSTTITSTLIMVLIFYVFGFSKNETIKKSKSLLALSIFTVIILGSGTGYGLLIIFGIYKLKPFKNVLSILLTIIVISLIYYLIFIYDIGSFEGLDKISKVYLNLLYELKIFQIENIIYDLSINNNAKLIGRQFLESKDLVIWSDFAWLNLYECSGAYGLTITIIIYLLKLNKYNYILLLVFMLGAIHYGAIYSLPGQMLFGYFISNQYKNLEQDLSLKQKMA